MFTFSVKLEEWSSHVADYLPRTGKKCTEIKNTNEKRAKLLFLVIKYAKFVGLLLPSRRSSQPLSYTFLTARRGLFHWTKKWIWIKFARCKYDGKLCLLQSKPVANAGNAIFATIFAHHCKYGTKYGIYGVCYRFALEQT